MGLRSNLFGLAMGAVLTVGGSGVFIHDLGELRDIYSDPTVKRSAELSIYSETPVTRSELYAGRNTEEGKAKFEEAQKEYASLASEVTPKLEQAVKYGRTASLGGSAALLGFVTLVWYGTHLADIFRDRKKTLEDAATQE